MATLRNSRLATLVMGVMAMASFAAVPPDEGPEPSPTWNRDIAPIIERRCLGCHRADGAAPFPLDGHASVAHRATFVGEVVRSGRMPPWLPGNDGFRGDRRLSETERGALMAWIEAGAPVGGDQAVSLERSEESRTTGGARIRIAMPRAGTIPEESDPAWHAGELDQLGVALPVGNRTELRVQAISHASAAPRAMRVTSLVFDDTGAGRYLDDRDPRVGFLMGADAGVRPSGADGILLSGNDELRWPEGFHQVVPPGADLVAELHYRPTGRLERVKERFELELVPPDRASRPVRWFPVGLFRVALPVGTKETLQSPVEELPMDVDLVGVSVRALEVCTALQVEATTPDGEAMVILEIDDWDHHQRETVLFEVPRRLPEGTRLKVAFEVDNTSDNPRNPDEPPVEIRRGRRTGILLAMLHVAAIDENDDGRLERAGPAWVRRRGRQDFPE